ncbi:MAG: GNAT family N-acetyltransferase [Chloroflexota bacterium]
MNQKLYTLRPARLADAAAIVAVRNASSQDVLGTNITSDYWQRFHWHEEGIDLANNCRVAVNEAGKVLGYVEVAIGSPYVTGELMVVVHPSARCQGLGTQLLRWGEARLAEFLDRAPEGLRVVIQSSVFSHHKTAVSLMEARGYSDVRRFIHLRIELTEPPIVPELPEGVEIRPLQDSDWDKVGPALGEAFEDHWGLLNYETPDEAETETDQPEAADQQEDSFVEDPDYFNSPGLCFVAWAGDEAIGSCLCNAKSVEFPDAGVLGSLSIRRPWRRQGIGLALTKRAFVAFYECKTIGIVTDTDGESVTGANNLYLKAGMHIYRQEIVFEKEIRAGRDVVKRTAADL